MNKFGLWGNKRIVLAWFVSYMLILFFTVFVNFMAYVQIESNIVQQNNHYVTELLENRKNSIDSMRQLVNNVAVEISHSEEVSKVAFSTDSYIGKGYYDIIEASQALSVYKNIEGEFQDIYVYFHRLDYCVGLNGCNVASTFFNSFSGDDRLEHSAWMSFMRENHPGEFVTVSRHANGEPDSVIYMLSLYGAERFIPYGTVVIEIDYHKIFPASAKESYNEAFYVVDEENKLFPSGMEEDKALQTQEIIDKYGVTNGISTVGDQIMIAADSDNSGWKYLYLVDKTVFSRSINAARGKILLFNLLGIGVTIFIAYLFTRKNYKPVQKLVNLLGRDEMISESEFRYIEGKISDIVEENRAFSMITEKLQDNTIRGAFLSRLLREKVPVNNQQEILESLGVSFPYSHFLVVLFYIEIDADMFFDHQNDNAEESYRLARLVLTNVLGDLLQEGQKTEYCDVDGMLACIVNLETADMLDSFVATVKRLRKFLLTSFNITFMAGVSDLHVDITALSECYNEAMTCVEQYFFNTNDVVRYTQLEQAALTDCYVSKIVEEQLVVGMKSGNDVACIDLLDQIFKNDIIDSGKSVQAVKCILYELTAIMIKTITEIGTFESDAGAVAELVGMIENVGVNVDVQEIKRHIQTVIRSFCAQNVQKTVLKTDVMAEKAKLYVDENYADTNLTVTMIAGHCKVSMAYLSTNFKRKYQMGLLEYINNVRIEHAKEILSQKDCTVERVAELVGYGNLRSFFRMFSRYVGTTPNKYRAMMLASRNGGLS